MVKLTVGELIFIGYYVMYGTCATVDEWRYYPSTTRVPEIELRASLVASELHTEPSSCPDVVFDSGSHMSQAGLKLMCSKDDFELVTIFPLLLASRITGGVPQFSASVGLEVNPRASCVPGKHSTN